MAVAMAVAATTAIVVIAEVVDQFMYGAIPVATGHTLDHTTDQHQGVADKLTVFKNG